MWSNFASKFDEFFYLFWPPGHEVLPLFWSELWRVVFLVIFTIIDSFTTNANLMLTISMLNLELYLLNWNFFSPFCLTLCLNLTFCLALLTFTKKNWTEVSKVFDWLDFLFWNRNIARREIQIADELRRQNKRNLRQISQI